MQFGERLGGEAEAVAGVFEEFGADGVDGEQADGGAVLGSGGEQTRQVFRGDAGGAPGVDLAPPAGAVEEVRVGQVGADGRGEPGQCVEGGRALGGRDGDGVERRWLAMPMPSAMAPVSWPSAIRSSTWTSR
ncbi:hypothetical protein ACWCYY_33275, partial [Kitasatospora sp. NPDC001664]